MSDEHDGAPSLSPDPFQFVVEQIARLGVKRSERLIHQQHVGFRSECPRQGHTLSHAARKLMNVAVLKLMKMNQAEIVTDFGFALRLRNILHAHSELHVLRDCEPRKKS